jgi:hypothetical protein
LQPGRRRLVVGRRDRVMPFLATVFLSTIMVYNFAGLSNGCRTISTASER